MTRERTSAGASIRTVVRHKVEGVRERALIALSLVPSHASFIEARRGLSEAAHAASVAASQLGSPTVSPHEARLITARLRRELEAILLARVAPRASSDMSYEALMLVSMARSAETLARGD